MLLSRRWVSGEKEAGEKEVTSRMRWTKERDEKLKGLLLEHGRQWGLIAEKMGEGSTASSVQTRYYGQLKDEVELKGSLHKWTKEEVEQFKALLVEHGCHWKKLADEMGEGFSARMLYLYYNAHLKGKVVPRDDFKWTTGENEELGRLVEKHGKDWERIGELLDRSPSEVRRHYSYTFEKKSERTVIRQQATQRKWTEEEDDRLLSLREKHGPNWSLIATELGTGRLVSSVQIRYEGNLDPRLVSDPWTAEEDRTVKEMRAEGMKWPKISDALGRRRSPSAVMRRYMYCLSDVNRGKWSVDELTRFDEAINRFSGTHVNWIQVAEHVGTRNVLQCRLQHGVPKLKRGKFTPAEDKRLVSLVAEHGQKWSMIGRLMNRRSANLLMKWQNHNTPSRGQFSDEEASLTIAAFKLHGPHWKKVRYRVD